MDENISQDFYSVILNATNVGVELNKFYSTAFQVEFKTSNIAMFNKLVKMYGRKIVFMSLLDMYDMENISHKNIYSLISFFCKKRFESESNSVVFSDLSAMIEKRKTDMSKKKFGKGANYLDATGDGK